MTLNIFDFIAICASTATCIALYLFTFLLIHSIVVMYLPFAIKPLLLKKASLQNWAAILFRFEKIVQSTKST